MTTIISPASRRLLRNYCDGTLPSSAVLQSIDATGSPVAEATVPCRVTIPNAQQGSMYPDDQRRATVLVPAETAIPDTIERVLVDGSALYRVDHVPPYRADDLLREIRCVESRESV